ncbi:hypothetical protein N658DRAFT_560353 [Parathielavia hyrcaniae]|uniref:Uncharacterized protein n=1 Tax=Parathielavia hyrcaniae TaxID=113614 RepID=A0AAN6PX62_9PEZI|nr:hypothetical protein N658DRAFT_560353 [Parathielavia hyrcaniae]
MAYVLDGFQGDVYGLDIVLSIIHYSSTKLTTVLMLPYIEKWVSGLGYHIAMQKNEHDDYKTLYIAWVIGEPLWFARMLFKFAFRATIDDAGYLSGEKESLKYCRSKDTNANAKHACIHQQLGSLMVSLSTAGLLPFPGADRYRDSVASLAYAVRTLTVNRFEQPGALPHQDGHINCGIRHREAVENALSEDAQYPGEIIERLMIRGHRTGAYNSQRFRKAFKTPRMTT